jgi:hypothetical protein
MERTVPSATSEEIKLYRSTMYSLLRSTAEVQIRTLEETHAGMNSLLHADVRSPQPDISALIYSSLRLPDCMPEVKSVILGQNADVFPAAWLCRCGPVAAGYCPGAAQALFLRRQPDVGLLHCQPF